MTGANTDATHGDVEEVLDIVQAASMAPGLSQILVYIGSNDADIYNRIASDNIAKQISVSWVGSNDAAGIENILKEMAAQGQTVFAASGDWGSYPVSEGSFPAEDAWVIAVGGTDLVTSGAGGSWQSETAWAYSGGGASPDGLAIPSWQTSLNGANGASTSLRNVPDVSAEANYDNYVCFSIGSAASSCVGGYGGTSFATPRWAGLMALVNQQAAANGAASSGLVLISSNTNSVYTLAQSSSYASYFHDITTGSDGAHSAGTGYDLVTGWGSPQGIALINALAPAPACQVTPSCYGSGNFAAGSVSLSCTNPTQMSTSAELCGLYGSGGCTTNYGQSGVLTSSSASVNGEAYSGASCTLSWCTNGSCTTRHMVP